MKRTRRRPSRLPEEGAVFTELEGRHLGNERKDDAMSNDLHETTNESHFAPVEAWDAIATGYDTYVAPREAGLATAALKLAGLKTGDRFLDVAAGPGGLSLPAARLGANVVATDWSPRMIERFNARVHAERLSHAEGKVMDCHALRFDDGTFDLAGSAFGVMLVPDQLRALREMARVTKPGGRVLVIAYGSPGEFQALDLFIGGLRAVNSAFGGIPSSPPPLEFQVSDPSVLRTRLEAAGLRNVSVDTTHRETIEIRSGEELWDWCVGSNPIPCMLVADLTDDQKATMRARLDEMIRARANGGAFAVLTAPLNVGIGTR